MLRIFLRFGLVFLLLCCTVSVSAQPMAESRLAYQRERWAGNYASLNHVVAAHIAAGSLPEKAMLDSTMTLSTDLRVPPTLTLTKHGNGHIDCNGHTLWLHGNVEAALTEQLFTNCPGGPIRLYGDTLIDADGSSERTPIDLDGTATTGVGTSATPVDYKQWKVLGPNGNICTDSNWNPSTVWKDAQTVITGGAASTIACNTWDGGKILGATDPGVYKLQANYWIYQDDNNNDQYDPGEALYFDRRGPGTNTVTEGTPLVQYNVSAAHASGAGHVLCTDSLTIPSLVRIDATTDCNTLDGTYIRFAYPYINDSTDPPTGALRLIALTDNVCPNLKTAPTTIRKDFDGDCTTLSSGSDTGALNNPAASTNITVPSTRTIETVGNAGLVRASGTVTVTPTVSTTALSSAIIVGTQVVISGATDTGFNGTFHVATRTSSPPSFTFTQAGGDATSGGGTATFSPVTIDTVGNTGVSRSSGVVTVTVIAALSGSIVVGDQVAIAGVTDSAFNGTFYVTGKTSTTFTYAQALGNATSGGGTAIFAHHIGPTDGWAYYDTDGSGTWGATEDLVSVGSDPVGGSLEADATWAFVDNVIVNGVYDDGEPVFLHSAAMGSTYTAGNTALSRFSLTWLGAAPRDGTDDSSLIIAGIKAVQGTGVALYVPPGTYELAATVDITLNGNLTMIGEPNRSIIRRSNLTLQNLFIFRNAGSAWIEGVTFDWGGLERDTVQGGIQMLFRDPLPGTGPFYIQNNTFTNSGGIDSARQPRGAFSMTGPAMAVGNAHDVWILNNYVYQAGQMGCGKGPVNCTIMGNHIKDVAENAITTSAEQSRWAVRTDISHNTIDGWTDGAIYLGSDSDIYTAVPSSDLTVSYNEIRGPLNETWHAGNGIIFKPYSGLRNVVISHNILSALPTDDTTYLSGIFISGQTAATPASYNLLVDHNIVDNFTGVGIKVAMGTPGQMVNAIIDSNIITDGDGLYCTNADKVNIANNILTNTLHGIFTTNCTATQVTDNQVLLAKVGGDTGALVVQTSGANTAEVVARGNRLQGNSIGIQEVNASGTLITRYENNDLRNNSVLAASLLSGAIARNNWGFVRPAQNLVTGGGTAGRIAANACGDLKQITSTNSITTDTTDTFDAPSATNTPCAMTVVNVDTTDTITLDPNTASGHFKTFGGAAIILKPKDSVQVASNGVAWYQTSRVVRFDGTIMDPAIAAPSGNPASGFDYRWFDVTDLVMKIKNSAGGISATAINKTCTGTDKLNSFTNGTFACTSDAGSASSGVLKVYDRQVSGTGVGNGADQTNDTMFTVPTLPSGTLDRNGKEAIITGTFKTAGNTHTKTIGVTFQGNQVTSSTFTISNGSGQYRIVIARVDVTHVNITVTLMVAGAVASGGSFNLAVNDLSANTSTLVVTASSPSASFAANDILVYSAVTFGSDLGTVASLTVYDKQVSGTGVGNDATTNNVVVFTTTPLGPGTLGTAGQEVVITGQVATAANASSKRLGLQFQGVQYEMGNDVDNNATGEYRISITRVDATHVNILVVLSTGGGGVGTVGSFNTVVNNLDSNSSTMAVTAKTTTAGQANNLIVYSAVTTIGQ